MNDEHVSVANHIVFYTGSSLQGGGLFCGWGADLALSPFFGNLGDSGWECRASTDPVGAQEEFLGLESSIGGCFDAFRFHPGRFPAFPE